VKKAQYQLEARVEMAIPVVAAGEAVPVG